MMNSVKFAKTDGAASLCAKVKSSDTPHGSGSSKASGAVPSTPKSQAGAKDPPLNKAASRQPPDG